MSCLYAASFCARCVCGCCAMAGNLKYGVRVRLKGSKLVGVVQGYTHENRKKLWKVSWPGDIPSTKHIAQALIRAERVSCL